MSNRADGWVHLQDIEGSESTVLQGKIIVLAITASVAALESHRLARQLMRYGAKVQVFMTPSAQSLVSPTALEWCTGFPVIWELSGRCEHLEFFGKHGKADLLLLAPATANTIAKVACGLDDNAVTTAVTTALGSGVPILCCPGMHEPMLANPAVARNLCTLTDLGVELLSPFLSEGKAKMMAVPEIVARVLRRLSDKSLAGQRVVLTGGPTREYIDPARCLTNPSSGLSACLLAEEAYRRGAQVKLLYGPGQVQPAPWLEVERVETSLQMTEAVRRAFLEAPVDYFFSVAAVSDFTPAHSSAEKLSTAEHKSWNLPLVRTPKIIDMVKELSPQTKLIGFKASSKDQDQELIEQARAYLSSGRVDMMVANPISIPGLGFESPRNRYLVCTPQGAPRDLGPADKKRLSSQLWDTVLEEFSDHSS